MINLRDGSNVLDPRLDRLVQFDDRSRDFPVMQLVPSNQKQPRSKIWRLNIRLDQGQEGACVGFGVTHELAALPAEVFGLTNKYARETIYWEAQRNDQWPGGAYPGAQPFYEGTSVLAGVKVAQKLGWMESYRWAFGLHELMMGVSWNGPAVMGLNWHEGMRSTDSAGFIRPTGRVIGGHCILLRGISIKHSCFLLSNSWGRPWGINGDCFISFDDMNRLLNARGEAVFFEGRRSKPVPGKG